MTKMNIFMTTMRRITLCVLAIASLFFASSCKKDKTPDKEKTCLDYVLTDYRALVDRYPDAKDHFVEARFVLDNIIADTPAADIKAKSLTTICYAWMEGLSQIYVCERDFETGETELINYQSDSPWLGDSHVSEEVLQSLTLSLEDAIAAAKKDAGAGDGISTANVTLRKPVYPFWDHPQYVFGGSAGRHDHVFVDSVTGKVSIEEMPVPEGSSSAFFLDDYNVIVDYYKNGDVFDYSIELQGKLVEVRYELNKAMNAELLSDLTPVKVTYVFYYPKTEKVPAFLISCTRNSFKMDASIDEFHEEPLSAPWTESRHFGFDFVDGLVALEDAIATVKLGNVTDPDTNLVTYSFPDGFERPVIIFKGNATPDVHVDAITGELMTE